LFPVLVFLSVNIGKSMLRKLGLVVLNVKKGKLLLKKLQRARNFTAARVSPNANGQVGENLKQIIQHRVLTSFKQWVKTDFGHRTSEFSSQSWSPHKAGLVGVGLRLWRSWSGLVGVNIKNHVSSIMIIGKRQDLSAMLSA